MKDWIHRSTGRHGERKTWKQRIRLHLRTQWYGKHMACWMEPEVSRIWWKRPLPLTYFQLHLIIEMNLITEEYYYDGHNYKEKYIPKLVAGYPWLSGKISANLGKRRYSSNWIINELKMLLLIKESSVIGCNTPSRSDEDFIFAASTNCLQENLVWQLLTHSGDKRNASQSWYGVGVGAVDKKRHNNEI